MSEITQLTGVQPKLSPKTAALLAKLDSFAVENVGYTADSSGPIQKIISAVTREAYQSATPNSNLGLRVVLRRAFKKYEELAAAFLAVKRDLKVSQDPK